MAVWGLRLLLSVLSEPVPSHASRGAWRRFGTSPFHPAAAHMFTGARSIRTLCRLPFRHMSSRLQRCCRKRQCQLDALVIGSHLESDAAMADACRIAFHGRLVERAEGDAIGEKIRLYKLKRKVGLVAKLGDPCVSTNGDMGVRDVVGKDLFARETNMAQFVGCGTVWRRLRGAFKVKSTRSRRWRLHETTSPQRRCGDGVERVRLCTSTPSTRRGSAECSDAIDAVARRTTSTPSTTQAPDPGRDGRGRQAVLGLWQRGQVPRAVRGPDGRAARR